MARLRSLRGTFQNTSDLQADLVDRITGSNIERFPVGITESDVGCTDLLFRLCSENRQVDGTKEFSGGCRHAYQARTRPADGVDVASRVGPHAITDANALREQRALPDGVIRLHRIEHHLVESTQVQ